MLQGYWQAGIADREACFDLFFRSLPFQGGYVLFAGLEGALRFLSGLNFSNEDIVYLGSLDLFADDFLDHLRTLRFTGDVFAMPEGSVVFPAEPLLRVHAPLEQCQLAESALLNIINFQSLIATKTSRICGQAGTDNVLEFGLRRAQGIDGALSASRAAFIGGCVSTSNVEAGKMYGIPVSGTQAHSWIMSFSSELESFRAYAETYPQNTVLLVDTYDTLQSGVPNAITVGLEMKKHNQKLIGIRLDSGDIGFLAAQARKMLDQAGLPEVRIVCSGDLDEYSIRDLKQRQAPIDSFGVGTRLVTAHGDSALTGVYKLAAIASDDGHLRATHKLSDEYQKATLPGVKQTWRLFDADGAMLADWVELAGSAPELSQPVKGYLPHENGRKVTYENIAQANEMQRQMMHEGQIIADLPSLVDIRREALANVAMLLPWAHELSPSQRYNVALGPRLWAEIQRLSKANS